MKKALFQRELEQRAVQCSLCAHHCRIKPGRRGICRVRENREGILYSLNYGRLLSENIDPIEKKPLFHLLPSSLSYSISTVGCNFHCRHCQNYEISQYPARNNDEIPGPIRTPEQVVAAARDGGCSSISYTYVEPTIFYEFALDTAKAAHQAGILNVMVSNGYMGPEATRELVPWLDADNIDLKAFTDRFYREVCGARLQPVLDNIILMHQLGIWLEITTLVIPGWNDSEAELREIAQFLASISTDIPWHLSRFWPTYQMRDRPPTPPETLRRAREIGEEAGLNYVYLGNLQSREGEDTICPQCQTVLVARHGFLVTENRLRDGACPNCSTPIAGRWHI